MVGAFPPSLPLGSKEGKFRKLHGIVLLLESASMLDFVDEGGLFQAFFSCVTVMFSFFTISVSRQPIKISMLSCPLSVSPLLASLER